MLLRRKASMYDHLTRQETLELAQAACHRYINNEITMAVLLIELSKLRGLGMDERDELITAANVVRNTRPNSSVHGASPMGRQFASPADRKRYEESFEWLGNYKDQRRGK
jgi:hypothetical protein